ncbi:MAG: class I SAM-dependent methyltransferase [Chloroflexota bacterium]
MTIHDLTSSLEHDERAWATQFDRFARFYDYDYRDVEDDVQLVLDLAVEHGGPILELGCGTARALVPLGKAGFSAHGIDISRTLLELAEQKIHAANLNTQISLYRDDIRSSRLPSTHYSLAFCLSNTLMHCESQSDQLKALQTAYHHLKPSGILMVDLFNPDIITLNEVAGLMELADSWIDERGQQVLKWSVRMLDISNQQQETTFIYEEIDTDGRSRRTVCPFTLRFIWPSEGELLLEKAGFQVLEIWGDAYGSAFDGQSERLIYLAQKP